ncbi:LysR family transcriptional regulator [Acidisoma silvae]|uniref:LysR family transcriptional regulator n=1 Tax=Acidisoma silvae TaxID=2802396 RepID=A0A963YVD2_9PROT|nr:LysR family transcriptional regulator [Acidisoma silvae]MCB8877852.1 LysR family transcriptional regulator [Acidisoma silvae]
MYPSFDIDALRMVVTSMEVGSFARAAIQLGRSQSAVSMQLKRLEEQAGRPLFARRGRNLVPTEAGEALLSYARRIVELHDEAATVLGTETKSAAIRLGLPQDFFEDVMPETIAKFARLRPGMHVEVMAGRNAVFEEEVKAGRLDLALAFFLPGSANPGVELACLPLSWFAGKELSWPVGERPDRLPLVLYDHPCLFRQAALRALDRQKIAWRLSLTTPSLPGVWAALRFGQGITVRTGHRVPQLIHDVGTALRLPRLPPIELRMLTRPVLSPASEAFRDVLTEVVRSLVAGVPGQLEGGL